MTAWLLLIISIDLVDLLGMSAYVKTPLHHTLAVHSVCLFFLRRSDWGRTIVDRDGESAGAHASEMGDRHASPLGLAQYVLLFSYIHLAEC